MSQPPSHKSLHESSKHSDNELVESEKVPVAKAPIGSTNSTSSIESQDDMLLEDNDYIDSIRAIVMGEVMDQVPKDLFIPPDALQVVLETFEGPLDLLLYLIRKQNLDIANIPIAAITEQYMGYVELMRRSNLDLAAEYLVMAAMLAEIKSRILLPKPKLIEEDEEDPRLALVRQLQQYERFREAANDLEDRPRVDRDVFIASARKEDMNPPKMLPKVSLQQLTRAFQDVLERAHVNQLHQVTRETMSMRERMTNILKRLNDSDRDFLRIEDLFTQQEGRTGLVVTFIALLELLRDDMLVLVQNDAFSPIHIKKAA